MKSWWWWRSEHRPVASPCEASWEFCVCTVPSIVKSWHYHPHYHLAAWRRPVNNEGINSTSSVLQERLARVNVRIVAQAEAVN